MARNKLNNRGYVLVEIILASVIAFGIAYYMLDLTIKLKNKNDDLLAKTLAMTDQAIIQNNLVGYMNLADFSCNKISVDKNTKVIKYDNNLIDIVNEYTTIGNLECSITNNVVQLNLPLTIGVLNEHYDVTLNYILK